MPRLTGKELLALREALLDALPTPEDWEEAVLLAFDRSLNALAGPAKLPVRAREVLTWAESRWETDSLIAVALDMAPKNEDLKRAQEALKAKISTLQLNTSAHFESVVRERARFSNVESWRADMLRCERAVCRIEENLTGLPGCEQPLGTGFLVGADLVLTNYHVVEDYLLKRLDAQHLAFRFDYKLDGDALASDTVCGTHADWLVESSSTRVLDYALVRLAKPAGRPYLTASRATFGERDPLMIIQHPKAVPLKFALGTITATGAGAGAARLRYDVNTQDGSSGSPCFLADWSLVALHHRGDIKHNEGIVMSAIADDLAAKQITLEHRAASSAAPQARG